MVTIRLTRRGAKKTALLSHRRHRQPHAPGRHDPRAGRLFQPDSGRQAAPPGAGPGPRSTTGSARARSRPSAWPSWSRRIASRPSRPDTVASRAADECSVAESGADRIVVLGRIGGTFGVQGWVKVQSYTEPPENILGLRPLAARPGRAVARGRGRRRQSDRRRACWPSSPASTRPEDARLRSGRRDRGAARASCRRRRPASTTGAISKDWRRSTAKAKSLGRIDHFRTTPAGTVVVIRGEREHWVPFVKERIVKVDLDAGRVVLDWAARLAEGGHAHRSGDAVPGVRRRRQCASACWAARSSAGVVAVHATHAARIRDRRASDGRRPAVRRRAGHGVEDRADAHGDPRREGAAAGGQPQRVSRGGRRAR